MKQFLFAAILFCTSLKSCDSLLLVSKTTNLTNHKAIPDMPTSGEDYDNCENGGVICGSQDCCNICVNDVCQSGGCNMNGYSCTYGSECCGYCVNGHCSSTDCNNSGGSCSTNADCCNSLVCSNTGVCATNVCKMNGDACTSGSECCQGYCVGGQCSSTDCNNSGGSCSTDYNCCNNSLVCASTGVCTTLSTCHKANESCSSNRWCCSGLTCQDGSCNAPPCGSNGTGCDETSDCCSGQGLICNSYAQTCMSCNNAGEVCQVDTDCCSGFHCDTKMNTCQKPVKKFGVWKYEINVPFMTAVIIIAALVNIH